MSNLIGKSVTTDLTNNDNHNNNKLIDISLTCVYLDYFLGKPHPIHSKYLLNNNNNNDNNFQKRRERINKKKVVILDPKIWNPNQTRPQKILID